MKAIATISTVILAAGMAAGQAAAYKPAAPASQNPAAKTKAAATTAKPAAKTAATKPAAKPATTTASKPAAAKPAAPKAEAQAQDSSRGRRDPFVSPVIVRMGTSTTSCSTGKRCLIIDQLVVEGVVKTVNGWIAVIGNPAKKVYYVRENDALFDGYVSRITGDSVVFRQSTIDAMGKTVQREVVKRVAPSV